jgi:NAD(P)-dependent dehydrogenase (short-subunit alcohol dehydrogenase family)
MAQGRGGSIVNISTVGSIHPRPDIVPYAAAKAGLNAMTLALAHAFGPTVRINCVLPGAFRTDVTHHWQPATFDAVARTTALQRIGEPEDMVGTIVYLASDAASYTTGAVFPVHGGVPA